VRGGWAIAWRAGSIVNIIPSSSGAARALGFIWKGLEITGKAYRMPARTGSIAELNLLTDQPVTVEAVNDAFRTSWSSPAASRRNRARPACNGCGAVCGCLSSDRAVGRSGVAAGAVADCHQSGRYHDPRRRSVRGGIRRGRLAGP
jgi:hypothetical protein